MNIELNPKLDLETLSAEFHEKEKLRIENIFTLESAEYILDYLKNGTSWHLVHSDEEGFPVRYGTNKLERLSEQDHQTMIKQLHQRATSGYQYIYKYFPIIDAIKAAALPESSMLFQIASFVNSAEFIGFARALTGTDSLVKVDPQATLYEPGHFLTMHDDSNYQRTGDANSTRRFAVVFGFTKNWSPNWGGQTSFFQSRHATHSESWYPGFNTLTIFKVPVLHCVNYVAPFAGKGRYSITGWLRDDPKIKREDLGDT